MYKEELLQELTNKINSGEITREEVLGRFPNHFESSIATNVKKLSFFTVNKFLYALGAIISIVGIILFASQIWPNIGSVERVTITLGMGFLLTIIGSLFLHTKPEQSLGSIFHSIGGVLIPGGAVVALYETLGLENITASSIAFTFSLIFLFYFLLSLIQKNVILTFFAIANGTVFIYSFMNAVTKDTAIDYVNLYTYLSLAVGAAYCLMAYQFREGWNKGISRALYFLGVMGMQMAVFYQYTSSWNRSMWPVVFSLGFLFVSYLLLNFKVKKVILTLLTIMNGTVFVYLLVEQLVGASFYSTTDIYIYLTMIMGVAYMLLAYSFRNGWNSSLVNIINFFGAFGLLSSAFSKIYGSPLWQMVFLVLVIGGFFLSIDIRSRNILVLNTLFLLAFISYITSEYFADSVGWPISLVVLGFAFIGLGYVSVNINKKYIAEA